MTEQEIALVLPDLQPWLGASDEQVEQAMRQLGETFGCSMEEFAEGMRLLFADGLEAT